MSTAVESARVGIAKYLVPFAFVYNPSLLFEGPLWLTAYSTLAAFAGVGAVSVALEGWLRGPLSPLLRVVSGLAAVCLIYPPGLAPLGLPGYLVNALGALGFALIYLARSRGAPGRRAAGERAQP
jgi:TRAP-type uncharacterized transport system fused permease subunit